MFSTGCVMSYEMRSNKKTFQFFIVATSDILFQCRAQVAEVTPSINIQKGSVQMIKATVLPITGTRSFFTKLDCRPARLLLAQALSRRGNISMSFVYIVKLIP